MITVHLHFSKRTFIVSSWDEDYVQPLIKDSDRVLFTGLIRRYVFFVAKKEQLGDCSLRFDCARAHYYNVARDCVDEKSPIKLEALLKLHRIFGVVEVEEVNLVPGCYLPNVSEDHTFKDWLSNSLKAEKQVSGNMSPNSIYFLC